MTNQELFDRVVAHLRTQGKKAVRETTCRYRTTDGLKCAVGCLIPDDKYRSSFEGRSVDDEIAKAAGIDVHSDQFNLATRLQRVHDNRDADEWEENLEVVALTFNLSYTPHV